MADFAASSVFFGLFITLAAYFIGLAIKTKTALAVMTPILIGTALVIALCQ